MSDEFDFECDPAKDAANREKHGVSLGFGKKIFDDLYVQILPTIREDDNEERFKAVGLVEGQLWTAVHVYRDDAIRLISVRRSNSGEQRAYHSDRSRPQ